MNAKIAGAVRSPELGTRRTPRAFEASMYAHSQHIENKLVMHKADFDLRIEPLPMV
jgi:hypothetical protein